MTTENDNIPLELRVQQTIKDKHPTLRNEFDAIVAVLHCAMREMGFICTGYEEKASSNGILSFRFLFIFLSLNLRKALFEERTTSKATFFSFYLGPLSLNKKLFLYRYFNPQ